jgi:uncharacterized protein YndB with AHSA1/START domain
MMHTSRFVECEIDIHVSPGSVIDAFTNPKSLAIWWGVEQSFIELKPNGVYSLGWGVSDDGVKYLSYGIIREYNPNKLLHIDKYMYYNPERYFLGPLSLVVRAEPTNTGSHVHLKQGPYPENRGADWDWYYDVVKDAWPSVLITLKSYLESGE